MKKATAKKATAKKATAKKVTAKKATAGKKATAKKATAKKAQKVGAIHRLVWSRYRFPPFFHQNTRPPPGSNAAWKMKEDDYAHYSTTVRRCVNRMSPVRSW